ncbi:MAG: SRPBCC domain-containing protein [Proteobacteria bacterium]|nr:SRPBCC domain-containing protein [Pseudomonadota bacterium]
MTEAKTGHAQFSHAHMVRFERQIDADPAAIWAVLTEPKRLPGWYGEATIEGRPGGTVSLMGGHIKGVVTQWQPPRRIAYTWNVFMPGQTVSDFPESYLTLELNDRTLTLTHLPVLDEFVKLNAAGWHTFLDMVDAAARGETVQPRETYMKPNAALYGGDLPGNPS